MSQTVHDGKQNKKKTIWEQIAVPSMFTLLFSVAAVLVGYGIFLQSTGELIAGMGTFLAGVCSNVYFNFMSMRKGAENHCEEWERSGHQYRKIEWKSRKVPLGSVLPVLFSLIIAFSIFIRIAFIMESGKDLPATSDLYVKVLKVRMQRYNQQLIVEMGGGGALAALYTPHDVEIRAGDILELDTQPCRISDSAKGSSFLKALKRKGIICQIHIRESEYRIHQRAQPVFKEKIRRIIDENIDVLFHKRTTPVLRALYFGNKSFIDKETITSFKRAGALHILAASGLHVGIIASLPFLVFGFFKINKRIILLVTIAIVFCYLYITDMPVSLVRACVMFSVYGIQRYFYLDRNIYNTLFISAIIILALYPYEFYGLGFQLTFGATLGIIILFDYCRQVFGFLPEMLAKSLSVTLAAQLFVFPIIFISLNEINLTGIISNIALVPGIGIALVMSIIANLVSLVSVSAALFIGFITDSIINNIRIFVDLISALPGHFIPGREWYYLLVPYFLIFFSVLPYFRRRKYSWVLVLAGYLLAWSILVNDGQMPDARITRMKNDTTNILLYKKEATAFVSGTFGNSDDVERVVRFINNSNISQIKLLIADITFDNIRHFSRLIKTVPVSSCYLPSGFRFKGFLTQFFSLLDLDSVKLEIFDIKEGVETSHGFRILPPLPYGGGKMRNP